MKLFLAIALIPMLATGKTKIDPSCKVVTYDGIQYRACPDPEDACQYILTPIDGERPNVKNPPSKRKARGN